MGQDPASLCTAEQSTFAPLGVESPSCQVKPPQGLAPAPGMGTGARAARTEAASPIPHRSAARGAHTRSWAQGQGAPPRGNPALPVAAGGGTRMAQLTRRHHGLTLPKQPSIPPYHMHAAEPRCPPHASTHHKAEADRHHLQGPGAVVPVQPSPLHQLLRNHVTSSHECPCDQHSPLRQLRCTGAGRDPGAPCRQPGPPARVLPLSACGPAAPGKASACPGPAGSIPARSSPTTLCQACLHPPHGTHPPTVAKCLRPLSGHSVSG